MLEKGRVKGHFDFDDKEMLAGLKLGECVDIELKGPNDETMLKAHVCKTKAKE